MQTSAHKGVNIYLVLKQMMANTTQRPCALCQRKVALTFHHLIPRKLHKRKRFQKNYSRRILNQGIWVCRQCHRGLHSLFDEATLGTQLNTLGALQKEPSIQKHIEWVKKQKEHS